MNYYNSNRTKERISEILYDIVQDRSLTTKQVLTKLMAELEYVPTEQQSEDLIPLLRLYKNDGKGLSQAVECVYSTVLSVTVNKLNDLALDLSAAGSGIHQHTFAAPNSWNIAPNPVCPNCQNPSCSGGGSCQSGKCQSCNGYGGTACPHCNGKSNTP